MDRSATLLVEIQFGGAWVEVGYLHKVEPKNWFEFAAPYWEMPNRPVLGQIFEEQGRAYKPTAHVSLPHWFSHLLPEGRLRDAVARAAHTSTVREFELLARLGQHDLPGATRVTSVISPADHSHTPDVSMDGQDGSDGNPILKFSLAGAQLKFSVYADSRGLTVPASGQAGNVILKFPDGRPGYSGVPEAELGALTLATESGIPTARAELWETSAVAGLEEWADNARGKALAVHRFDRNADGTRLHMEEFAQVLNVPTKPEEIKYKRANFETIALLVGALIGEDAVRDVIDRIVFNVLVGNGDAHVKNWAFLYPDGKSPTLSPLYDVLPTVLFVANDDLGMNLDKSKRFESISSSSFSRLGARTGLGVGAAARQAKEAATRVLDRWDVLKAYLRREQFERLSARLRGLEIKRELS